MIGAAQQQKSLNPAFTEALAAYDRGWSVVPASRDKRPVIPWSPYQVTRADYNTLTSWGSYDAFALVTGKLSGVVVLDVDPGGTLALHGKHLPPTIAASTPRQGLHYYYKHPGYKVKTSTNILGMDSHVDMRGDGGIVILPNGDDREWLFGLTPNDVDLAVMPDWLCSITRQSGPVEIGSTSKNIITCTTSITSILLESEDSPLSLRKVRGDILQDWMRDPGFIASVMRLLGIEQIGKPFHCILPDHQDTRPSASLYQMDSGHVLYRDWHGRSGEQGYFLPEVRASLAYGKACKLSKPELAVWSLRLLTETGYLRPAQVDMPELPPTATRTAKKLRDGLRLLFGCRWLHTHGDPAPFSHRFAAAWCGVSKSLVGDGIGALLKNHVIYKAGNEKQTNLFLPCPVKS